MTDNDWKELPPATRRTKNRARWIPMQDGLLTLAAGVTDDRQSDVLTDSVAQELDDR